MNRTNIILGLLSCVATSGFGATFTIASNGTGNFATLTQALATVTSETVTPTEFVFQDAGPYEEGRIIINESKGGAPLTIRAANPSIRPILSIAPSADPASSVDGAVYIRRWGEPLIMRDLIVIPRNGYNNIDDAIKVDILGSGPSYTHVTDRRTSITFQNILVSGNNGSNQPVASLDGKTSPVIGNNYTTFGNAGFEIGGGNLTDPRNVYLYDCVVSGLNGAAISNGVRLLSDGIPGSELVVGPGCVFSFNNTLNTLAAVPPDDSALQSGNNDGGIDVRVEGSQEKPVLVINNNYNGIFQTGSSAGFSMVKWAISANNAGAGYMSRAPYPSKNFENVTFANNGYYSWSGGSSANDVYGAFDSATNVIFAGNGETSPSLNLVEGRTGNPDIQTVSQFTISNSAIVLSGPFSLDTTVYNGDGLDDESPSNFILNGIVNSDPQFASLDPASPNFMAVTNPAYGTAGPNSQPLVGGGRFGTTSVADWQLF